MRSGVKLFEPRARVGKTKPVTPSSAQNTFQSRSCVTYTQSQNVTRSTGTHADNACRALWFNSVLDRVFDQWLQNERRDAGIEQIRFDRFLDAQAFSEARLLDSEVAAEKIEFAPQRNFLFALCVECGAKQLAQMAEHSVGGARVGVN